MYSAKGHLNFHYHDHTIFLQNIVCSFCLGDFVDQCSLISFSVQLIYSLKTNITLVWKIKFQYDNTL